MKKAIYFLSIVLLLVAITALGQTTIQNDKISLSFENILLKDLITVLQKTHGLKISFSIDHTPVNSRISIHANHLPLSLFLEILCNEAGLTYQIIDNHIVLREQEKAAPRTKKTHHDHQTTNHYEQKVIDSTAIGYSILKPIEGHRQIQDSNNISKIPVQEVPESLLNKAALRSNQTKHTNLHVRRKPTMGIGVFASYDHLRMQFEDRPNSDQRYVPDMNFSAGLGASLGPGEKMSASFKVLLSSKNYFLNYNYKIIDPEDPYPFPDKTKVTLFFLQFPMDLSYRFYKKDKFSLYFSAGLLLDILIRKQEYTSFLNSEDKETAYFVNDHNKFLFGGSLGLKCWYDLDRSFSVFIEPDLVSYFTPFNEVIKRSNPQILKVNSGLILHIHPVKFH